MIITTVIKTGLTPGGISLKLLILEHIYENFMSCNINLATQQFQKFENEKWKADLETKPKLRVYKIKEEKKHKVFVQINMNLKERFY